ncbi:MAG: hypothetical protein ACREL6_10005 [Gemmatimonadales bacterium]
MTGIMRRRSFRILTALMLSFILPSRSLAQHATIVDSGTVVRLSLPADTVRGRLIAPIQSSALLITYCRYPGAPCRTPLAAGVDSVDASSVVHLDVANGSNWKRGALIGGAIGGALGGLSLALSNGWCDYPGCSGDRLPTALGLTVAGAAIGAVFGATSLTWERIW